MKNILKNGYVMLSTLILIILASFVATKEAATVPHFQIHSAFGQQEISIFDAQNGNFYVFLPSHSQLDQVTAILPSGQNFMLGDTRLSNKMTCGDFELETPYDFSVDGVFLATLWFYRSENVASMFIDTVTGEMTDIHNDKEYEEYASMTLYLPDGSVDHYDGSSKLKGRGNATWEKDKRPYLLSLSSEGDLLGMGRAEKWVLLANAFDETNLNNKLVYDLASQLPIAWSPDSRFVDLYLNGEYRGLYLLTEKVEVQQNRLNIASDSGNFLCKVDLWDRIDLLQNPVETSMGRIIEVCFPDVLSDQKSEDIQAALNALEQEITSESDLQQSEILDLDSWVRCYLIDEISGNIDADLTSSYFYYSGGKFFAGPIWDYDLAFGNHFRNQEPVSFLAKNEYKSALLHSPYYSQLYANESFYRRLTEIYRTEFVPVLQQMIHRDVDAQVDLIRTASRMNSIRWRYMYDEWIYGTAEIVQSSEDLKDYLTRRIDFLNQVWLEDQDYCTVQFETDPYSSYWNISVKKGTCLETSYMNLESTPWLDNRTGQSVDFQKPIDQDLILVLEMLYS